MVITYQNFTQSKLHSLLIIKPKSMRQMELNQIHLVGVVRKWAELQLTLDLMLPEAHERTMSEHVTVECEKMASDRRDQWRLDLVAVGEELERSSGNQHRPLPRR